VVHAAHLPEHRHRRPRVDPQLNPIPMVARSTRAERSGKCWKRRRRQRHVHTRYHLFGFQHS
jgi:hypothetical protein